MARQKLASAIDLSGPFFRKDPRKTFRANVRDFMDEVAALGEADVKAQLQQGEGSRQPMRGISPTRVSGHVRGRTKSLVGRRWAVSAVVSVQNRGFTKKQGTRLMAAGALLERRTHAFRRTTTRLRRVKKDLLKGLR